MRYVLHYAAGGGVAEALAAAIDAQLVPLAGDVTAEAFASRWKNAEAFVFVGALAIAVRSVAPLLRDKAKDPALVVVSEDGEVVLPVVSGHVGGATDLAKRCAEALASRGAVFTPTTASDRSGYVAPDLWAARRGYHILLRGGLVSVIRKLNDTGEIAIWEDPLLEKHGVSLPYPAGYAKVERREDADLIVSPRSLQKLAEARPQIVPRVLAAGIGCRRDVPGETIERVLHLALSTAPTGPFLIEALGSLRTVEAKAQERGLRDLAHRCALPLVVVSNEEILAMGGEFTESAAKRHIGIPAAAEPAAASAGDLLGARVAEEGVTVALAAARPEERGELVVVGSGPGDVRLLTQEAREALTGCDVLVGYNLYVDLLPDNWKRGKIVERYGMGEEEERVRRAIGYARSGYRVALVSGGDASLFGLSALTLSSFDGEKGIGNLRVLPGITAAQAAGVAVGAPYSNGLALLSLSDYLQPWEDVVRAMDGAKESGLTVAIYNPVRRGLAEKLAEVRQIFADRRLLLVRDAGRDDESVREIPMSALDEDAIDMRTMMLVLSPKAREISLLGKKLWIEARGYESEREAATVVEEAPVEPLREFLILGGTTEGYQVANALLAQGRSVTCSVSRQAGLPTVPEGAQPLIGARDADAWTVLFRDAAVAGNLRGVVDATHPFAEGASREIQEACRRAGIALCRYVRPSSMPEWAIAAADLDAAIGCAIDLTAPGDVVFLSIGVNNLAKCVPLLKDAGRRVLARMLPTVESMRRAERAGLEPREIVAIWGAGNAAFNEALGRDRNVRCIVSKESGTEGGVAAKGEAAVKLGIPLILIARPPEAAEVERAAALEEVLAWCERQERK